MKLKPQTHRLFLISDYDSFSSVKTRHLGNGEYNFLTEFSFSEFCLSCGQNICLVELLIFA